MPASSSSSPVRTAVGRKSPLRIQEFNVFIAAMLAATLSETGKPLWQERKVQQFLGRPGGSTSASEPMKITTAVAMGQRRLWANHTRPYRDAWLKLHRSVGVNPVVPLANHRPPAELEAKSMSVHIGNEIASVSRKNVAHAPPRYTGLPASLERMVVREIPKKVIDRSSATTSAIGAGHETLPATREVSASNSPAKDTMGVGLIHPRDEHRHQAEHAVNQCVVLNASAQDDIESGSPQITYSFEARRKFTQALIKQQRASDEQGFFASSSSPKLGSAVSLAGQSLIGSPKKTQVGKMMRARGAGSHSLDSPQGVLGHFHNTTAIHSADSSHGWPQSLDVRLDGNHIDHARDPPVKADPKFSLMTREEQRSQFSTYFGKAVHDNFETRNKASRDQLPDADKFRDWRCPEARADIPDRHGRFGKRVFDPSVREKPVQNQHAISEIDDKPHDVLTRERERVEEVLHRRMPSLHEKHFQQYQPPCEQPLKYEELHSRSPVRCAMDGEQKTSKLGYGQTRHSGYSDPSLYIRPLGAGHMDSRLPLS